MRFSCERDDLYKAVQGVLGVVASKGVHPVYESVQITGGTDALTLQADVAQEVDGNVWLLRLPDPSEQ